MSIWLALVLACGGESDKSGGGGGGSDSGTPSDSGGGGADGGGDGSEGGEEPAPMTLSAPGFLSSEGHDLASECAWILPEEHSCEGGSPQLTWTEVPMGTAALVLIFDDPDAANWPHWAVLNIPPEESGLAAGISGYGLESELPAGAEELENGAGYAGYYGSCPPRAHVYRWRLWAVDQALTAPAEGGAKARFLELAEQAEAHALGGAELCHIYDPRG